MIRSFKQDGAFITMSLKFQGSDEAAHWRRCFTEPMPTTHKFSYRWLGDFVLEFGPLEDDGQTPPQGVTGTPATFPPMTEALDAAIEKSADQLPPLDKRAALFEELKKLSRPDLETRAAEKGIKYKPKDDSESIIAKMLDKLAPAAKPAK